MAGQSQIVASNQLGLMASHPVWWLVRVQQDPFTSHSNGHHERFDRMFTTKPMIAATKKNEKIACSSVTRRMAVVVTTTSEVAKHIAS